MYLSIAANWMSLASPMPGGTMKRQWGFDYTLMKGKQKVDGDVGLMFIAYLFTRMRNILGLQGFWEAVRAFLSRSFRPYIPVISHLPGFRMFISNFQYFCTSYRPIQNIAYIYRINWTSGRF
jgi:hypothetical protein